MSLELVPIPTRPRTNSSPYQLVPIPTRSQAPAWERLSSKLRFARSRIRIDSEIGCQRRRDPLRAKQSFEDLRSQAPAWERVERVDAGTR